MSRTEALAIDPRNPKKLRRLDNDPLDKGGSYVSESNPWSPICQPATKITIPNASYKDTLMGESNGEPTMEDKPIDDDDIKILEGDVVRYVIDGLISIQFSKQIQTLVEKNLDRTIVLKLLGKCTGPVEDFLTVLADGPKTFFGHYLIIEQWTPDFSPSQSYPSKVVTWMRVPGLPATLYKRSLIKEIGNFIGLVIRIDYQG
ncbi:hypothetical protein V6N11_057933 [Hibiscus sabdariffa]|uniref:DUF4283 domain-containing protein n=1 Tax=Hibiscus sabdariffa TaxID=183260 RepID=A0ABR2P499_9ROSI